MSLSFGSKKQSTTQKSSSETQPWEETIPFLKDFLRQTRTATAGGIGPTSDQSAAFAQLKANAAEGNPFAGDIRALTSDLFGTESRAPMVEAGFGDFSRRLSPIADGTNLDIAGNPFIQDLLTTISDDVQWRTNSMFAGAGRDLSGINQQAVARGITQAQAPILLDQFNRETARTDAAARDLFAGSQSAATTATNLDTTAFNTRSAGIDTAKAFTEARDQGPNAILALEEQMKRMPFEELSWLAELLFPAAGLGQQTEEQGTSKGKGSSFGLGLKLI